MISSDVGPPLISSSGLDSGFSDDRGVGGRGRREIRRVQVELGSKWGRVFFGLVITAEEETTVGTTGAAGHR